MKIDHEKLKALSALPDEQLWQSVVEMAGKKGISLPKTPPERADMARLRGAMEVGEGLRPGDAAKLLHDYKKKYMK